MKLVLGLNPGYCLRRSVGQLQAAMCVRANCLNLWDADCQNKPTPKCKQKIWLPTHLWFVTKSWHRQWRQTSCPNCRCQKQHPYQHPYHAGQESNRSCQVQSKFVLRAEDLVAYSCELRICHGDAAATMVRKSAAFKEAPPIKPPSMSFCASKLAALAAFILPPYSKAIRSGWELAAPNCARNKA